MTDANAKRILPAALTVGLVLIGCTARMNVTRLDPASGTKKQLKGMAYALPRTVIKVELPAKKTTYALGQYWEFRKLFVPGRSGLPNEPHFSPVSSRTVAKYKVLTPTVSTSGEPDPQHVYYLQIQDKGTLKQIAQFQLTEAGSVTGLMSEVDNQTLDVVLAGIGALTGVLTRTALGFAGEERIEGKVKCDGSKKDTELTHFLLCAKIKKNYDGLNKPEQDRIKSIFATNVDDPDNSVLDRSDLLAARDEFEELSKYIARTNDLLEAGTGGNAFGPEFIVKRRDEVVEKRIRALFTETAKETTWTGIFHIRPPELTPADLEKGTSPAGIELITLSGSQGVCSISKDLVGLPLPADFNASGTCTSDRAARLDFELTPKDQYAQIFSRHFLQPSEKGYDESSASFRFRVPARTRATVAIKKGNQKTIISESFLMIAQFGAVGAVPAKLGGKTVAYDMQFYDASGALKSFKLTSQPLITKGVVDSLSASTNALLDARQKQQEEAKQAADELNQLERRRKLLEERNKIRLLCADLGIPESECEY